MQRRLAGLGFSPGPADGVFGLVTEAATSAFQDSVGVDVDGICGPHTWSALVDASYRLGDRLLYLTRPMLRGDDVTELQRRLGQLGFDPQRIDGIMGPDTVDALLEFQSNTGLPTDGICGTETLSMFRRLSPRAGTDSAVVSAVREVERVRGGPRDLAGRTVVIGEPGGLDALVAAVRRVLTDQGAQVVTTHHPEWSNQADQANELDADVFLGLVVRGTERSVCYFGTPAVESATGRQLACCLATEFADLWGDVPVRGMRLPILRETRMPAVLCRLGPVVDLVPANPRVALHVANALRHWISLHDGDVAASLTHRG